MVLSYAKKDFPYSHLEVIQIDTGDRLRVVPDRGGLITEWFCNGREILYFDLDRFNQKGRSIRGGIPMLFPICGNLPNDLLNLPDGEFILKQHGFARNLPWQLNLLDDDSGIKLTLNDFFSSKLTKL